MIFAFSLLAFLLGFFAAAFYLKQRQEKLKNDLTVKETELRIAHENLSQQQEQQKLEIEQITQNLIRRGSEQLEVASQKNLKLILDPLKEKIGDFEKKVGDAYNNEARERFALRKEIEKIIESNDVMSKEARSLSLALKGDIKAQGNWGEVILEKLLNAAGLREGHEYTTQGGQESHSGARFRPDVIVNLPDNKHLIIDSKVSFLAYQNYVSAQEKSEQTSHLKDFQKSIYAHIQGLSQKHYSDLKNVNSPDFVFLFIPVEAAFLLAHQEDPSLFAKAWEKKIVVVGPSTLLPSLRTVASLWKTEYQNRHALEIARQAGALYDKFVGFIGDLQKIDRGLSDARKSYQDAFSKLKEGRGNLIRSTEKLKELGAKAQKKLPKDLVDDSAEAGA